MIRRIEAPAANIFPINLPGSKWVQFSAAGFSHPVTGVIYRKAQSATANEDNADRDRNAGFQQHHHGAAIDGDGGRQREQRHAHRLGGSIQRKLHFGGHDAQRRLGQLQHGKHYDSGGVVEHRLRYVHCHVYPRHLQFLKVQFGLWDRLGCRLCRQRHGCYGQY